MEPNQELIKKIIENIKKTVQKYGEVAYRSRGFNVFYGRRYYNRLSIGKLLSDTELKDVKRLRIDYLKSNDTVVLVISKPH